MAENKEHCGVGARRIFQLMQDSDETYLAVCDPVDLGIEDSRVRFNILATTFSPLLPSPFSRAHPVYQKKENSMA